MTAKALNRRFQPLDIARIRSIDRKQKRPAFVCQPPSGPRCDINAPKVPPPPAPDREEMTPAQGENNVMAAVKKQG
jgi:hypothetical protein